MANGNFKSGDIAIEVANGRLWQLESRVNKQGRHWFWGVSNSLGHNALKEEDFLLATEKEAKDFQPCRLEKRRPNSRAADAVRVAGGEHLEQ